jgi:Tol biopolymer transport system component
VIAALLCGHLGGLVVSSAGAQTVPPDPAGDSVAEVFFGAISTDARLLTFTDWSTGDLVVRDLETGITRSLTHKSSWDTPEFAQAVQAMSPDGRFVAYGWQDMTSCDLRVVGLDGSEPHVLHSDDAIANVLPHDWSRDGRHILATFAMKDGTDRIALISVADGSVRVLKTFDAAGGSGAGNMMFFSPDGLFVVYDSRSVPDSPERDIRILSVDGSLDRPLVDHPANDFVLGWYPDDNWVLFASDRQGTVDAWAVGVEDGQSRGRPRLVRSGMPPTDWGMFTRDGAYYYSRIVWKNDVYVAAIDFETNTVGTPTRLVEHVGFNTAAEFSPDGRQLAYAFGLGRHPSPFVLGIRTLETGEDVRLRLEMERLGGHAFEPHWSPDGQTLLGSGRRGIRHIDARSGEVTILVGSGGGCPGGGDCFEWPVWASDGRVLFTRFDNGVPRRIFVRNLASDRGEELYRVAAPVAVSQLTVSPDALRLAFVRSDTDSGISALMVVPTVAGGEPQELVVLPPPQGEVPFDVRRGVILRPTWSPDGHYVLFGTIKITQESWGFELWRIPSDGGARESLGLVMEGLRPYGLSVHPDGRSIAITAGTPRRQETWVLDLLPPEVREERPNDHH